MYIETVIEEPKRLKRKRKEALLNASNIGYRNGLKGGMENLWQFRKDLLFLHADIGPSALSRVIGISRASLYRYVKGITMPSSPLLYGAVISCAEELRKQKTQLYGDNKHANN